MHAIILLVLVFLNPTPAANGQPAQPERAYVKAVIAPDVETCEEAGNERVSQLEQDPRVAFAGYQCKGFANPKDKQT